MSEHVSIDTASVNRWVESFHDEFNLSVDAFLRRQMRLCLRDVIAWTPPKTLAKGRTKVAQDYGRSMQPAEATGIISKGIHSRIAGGHEGSMRGASSYDPNWGEEDIFTFQMNRAQKMIQQKNYAGFNALMLSIGGKLAKWTAVPFSESLFFNAPKGPAGGKKSQHKFIFDIPAWKRLRAKLQSHVGRLKAAWGRAYKEVGGSSLPSWVERHVTNARGAIEFPNPQQTDKEITAINYAFGVAGTKDIVTRAVKTRGEAMRKEYHLVVKGIKNVSQLT